MLLKVFKSHTESANPIYSLNTPTMQIIMTSKCNRKAKLTVKSMRCHDRASQAPKERIKVSTMPCSFKMMNAKKSIALHNLKRKRKRLNIVFLITINKLPANLRLFPMKTSQRIRAKRKFLPAQKNHSLSSKPNFKKC